MEGIGGDRYGGEITDNFCTIIDFIFLYQFDKCLLQMVGTLHATSVRKKEEGRRKKYFKKLKYDINNYLK
ncbi:MAG: hypothetical protein F6K39_33665 [Okeania sp. SIO3B3]|nr:hypothetical protein [Okeania sp. SIO3B3]